MTEKNYKQMLAPAIYKGIASGRERNPCEFCGKKLNKDEEIVEIFSSSHMNGYNYSNRFHLKCWFKVIAFNFSEMFENKTLQEIKKFLMLEKL